MNCICSSLVRHGEDDDCDLRCRNKAFLLGNGFLHRSQSICFFLAGGGGGASFVGSEGVDVGTDVGADDDVIITAANFVLVLTWLPFAQSECLFLYLM